jgi:hypothetical protein
MRKVIGFREIDGWVDASKEFEEWMNQKDKEIAELKDQIKKLNPTPQKG